MLGRALAMACSSASELLALLARRICLSLAQAFFDGVEVGRVGRQVEDLGTVLLESFSHTVDLVGTEVVHDHDISWPELRAEDTVQNR